MAPFSAGVTREALFFDLDGCLVDSRSAVPACINTALTANGLPAVDEGAIAGLIGPPLPVMFASLLDSAATSDDALIGRLIAKFREAYRSDSARLTTVVTGVPAMLDVLARRRAAMFVCTSKPQPLAVELIRELNLTGWFEGVFGPPLDDVVESKSATLSRALSAYRHAADGTSRGAACAMIGDRRHDVEAGIANGIATIGVTWGSGTRRELQAAGAGAIADDPSDVPALLERLLR